jgi:phosphoglycerate dehydrogenase-like enzyme
VEGPRRAILDMADRRPVWALPDWVPSRVRETLPDGWELLVMEEETDGSGDGAARVSKRLLEAVRDAEVYFGYGIPAELLRSAPGLGWVHSGAAGVGSSLTPEMLASPVLFTNSAGIHATPISETVLAMILYFGRGLDLAVAAQHRGTWDKGPFYGADSPLRELADTTVGIVGFGGIGREVARRVLALGGRVLALKRTAPGPSDADLEPIAGGGRSGDRIDVFHGDEGLMRLLRESDVVVLAAPETASTRGILGAAALASMRAGTVVVNVARGRLLDETALVAELKTGRLRGAGLDVFAREPLPTDDPLWSLPNVLITPHVSAVTGGFWRRECDLICENVRRYVSGRPLLNLVDKRAGY